MTTRRKTRPPLVATLLHRDDPDAPAARCCVREAAFSDLRPAEERARRINADAGHIAVCAYACGRCGHFHVGGVPSTERPSPEEEARLVAFLSHSAGTVRDHPARRRRGRLRLSYHRDQGMEQEIADLLSDPFVR